MKIIEIEKLKFRETAKKYSQDFNYIVFGQNLKNITCEKIDNCNIIFELQVGETERNYLDIVIFDGYDKTRIATINIFKELDPNFEIITSLLKEFLNNEQKRISEVY